MTGIVFSYVTVALLSLAMGSFLTVVIVRSGTSLGGRSRCWNCERQLQLRDLVPVMSWLAYKGRSRCCRAAIPLFYPGIELTALAVGLSAIATGSGGLDLAFRLFLGFSLVLLAGFDFRYMLLPLPLTVAVGGAGMAHAYLTGGLTALQASLLGWVTGFAALWLVKWAYRKVRYRDGLGGGDVWLFAAAGAWLGAGALPWVMLIAAGLGLFAAWLQHLPAGAAQRLPFGPWLAAATWLVLVANLIAFP